MASARDGRSGCLRRQSSTVRRNSSVTRIWKGRSWTRPGGRPISVLTFIKFRYTPKHWAKRDVLLAITRAKERPVAKAGNCLITRRHLVAAGGALTVGGPFQAVAAVDPIFSAIEAHRRVYAEILALLDAQTAADRAVQQADALTRPALEARLDELCRAEGPLGRLEIRASKRMAATVPETLDGAVAVLRYLRELFARDQYAPFEEEGYRTLLFSAEGAIARHIVNTPPPSHAPAPHTR